MKFAMFIEEMVHQNWSFQYSESSDSYWATNGKGLFLHFHSEDEFLDWMKKCSLLTYPSLIH